MPREEHTTPAMRPGTHTHVLCAPSMSHTHVHTRVFKVKLMMSLGTMGGLCTLKSVGFKSLTGSSVWLKISCHSLRMSLSLPASLSPSLFLSLGIWFHSFRSTTVGPIAVVGQKWGCSFNKTLSQTPKAVFLSFGFYLIFFFFICPASFSSPPPSLAPSIVSILSFLLPFFNKKYSLLPVQLSVSVRNPLYNLCFNIFIQHDLLGCVIIQAPLPETLRDSLSWHLGRLNTVKPS